MHHDNPSALDRQAQEAERSVLGACLLHADAVPDVSFLRSVDFVLPKHQTIYQAIGKSHSAKGLTDPINVADQMRPDDLQAIGGLDHLIDLLEGVITAAGVEEHARIVKEHADRRRQKAAHLRAIERLDGGDDAGEVHAHYVQIAEHETEAKPVLDVTFLSDLGKLGNRKAIVEGVLLDDSLNVLSGPPKSYKTTLGDALSIAIADGSDWLGRKVYEPGLAVDFSLEGILGKKARYQAQVGAERWLDTSDPVHRRLALIRAMPDITSISGQDLVLRTLEHVCKVTGEPLRLLKVDTLARGLAACGRDENATSDMGAFIGGLDRIRAAFPCAQLVVHHEGKNGNLRGNSALNGAYDLLIRSKPAGKGRAALTFPEARDIETPPGYDLSFSPVVVGEDEHGNHITAQRLSSAVMASEDDGAGAGCGREQQANQDAADVAVYLLRNPGSGAVKLEQGMAGKMGKARIGAARHRLGAAVCEIAGAGNRKHLHINGAAIAPEVLQLAPLSERPKLANAKPPELNGSPGLPKSPQASPGDAGHDELSTLLPAPLKGEGYSPAPNRTPNAARQHGETRSLEVQHDGRSRGRHRAAPRSP